MRTRYLVFLIIIFIIGCDKPNDEVDYRTPYTGEFTFTTIEKNYGMCYDSSASCVDGWSIVSDTTILSSAIESIDSNRLKIQFDNGIFYIKNPNHYDSDTLYCIFNLILLPDRKLDFPEFEDYNLRYFNGYYIGFDTIYMDMRYGLGGIGSYTKYEIIGIRNK